MSYSIWDQGYSLWDIEDTGTISLWDYVSQSIAVSSITPIVDWRSTSYFSNGDIDRLAVGCLHLLLDRAVMNFPTSSRSHPSYFVVVDLSVKGPLYPNYKIYFPFQVSWDLWQQVIVPVLQPESATTDLGVSIKDKFRETLRNWKNVDYLNFGNTTALLEQLKLVIATLMEIYGYIPSGTVGGSLEGLSESELAPGEPVVEPTPGDPNYPQQDPDIVWPEGNIRLTYPIIL